MDGKLISVVLQQITNVFDKQLRELDEEHTKHSKWLEEKFAAKIRLLEAQGKGKHQVRSQRYAASTLAFGVAPNKVLGATNEKLNSQNSTSSPNKTIRSIEEYEDEFMSFNWTVVKLRNELKKFGVGKLYKMKKAELASKLAELKHQYDMEESKAEELEAQNDGIEANTVMDTEEDEVSQNEEAEEIASSDYTEGEVSRNDLIDLSNTEDHKKEDVQRIESREKSISDGEPVSKVDETVTASSTEGTPEAINVEETLRETDDVEVTVEVVLEEDNSCADDSDTKNDLDDEKPDADETEERDETSAATVVEQPVMNGEDTKEEEKDPSSPPKPKKEEEPIAPASPLIKPSSSEMNVTKSPLPQEETDCDKELTQTETINASSSLATDDIAATIDNLSLEKSGEDSQSTGDSNATAEKKKNLHTSPKPEADTSPDSLPQSSTAGIPSAEVTVLEPVEESVKPVPPPKPKSVQEKFTDAVSPSPLKEIGKELHVATPEKPVRPVQEEKVQKDMSKEVVAVTQHSPFGKDVSPVRTSTNTESLIRPHTITAKEDTATTGNPVEVPPVGPHTAGKEPTVSVPLSALKVQHDAPPTFATKTDRLVAKLAEQKTLKVAAKNLSSTPVENHATVSKLDINSQSKVSKTPTESGGLLGSSKLHAFSAFSAPPHSSASGLLRSPPKLGPRTVDAPQAKQLVTGSLDVSEREDQRLVKQHLQRAAEQRKRQQELTDRALEEARRNEEEVRRQAEEIRDRARKRILNVNSSVATTAVSTQPNERANHNANGGSSITTAQDRERIINNRLGRHLAHGKAPAANGLPNVHREATASTKGLKVNMPKATGLPLSSPVLKPAAQGAQPAKIAVTLNVGPSKTSLESKKVTTSTLQSAPTNLVKGESFVKQAPLKVPGQQPETGVRTTTHIPALQHAQEAKRKHEQQAIERRKRLEQLRAQQEALQKKQKQQQQEQEERARKRELLRKKLGKPQKVVANSGTTNSATNSVAAPKPPPRPMNTDGGESSASKGVKPLLPNKVPKTTNPKTPEKTEIVSQSEDGFTESESEDDYIGSSKGNVSQWAHGAALKKAVHKQCVDSVVDPDKIFGPIAQLELEQIFSNPRNKRVRRPRGSSAHWHRDGLTSQEIAKYRHEMGFASPGATSGDEFDNLARLHMSR